MTDRGAALIAGALRMVARAIVLAVVIKGWGIRRDYATESLQLLEQA